MTKIERFVTPAELPTPHQRELLVILIEECAEVQKRATKSLRFGLMEIQPEQEFTNVKRLGLEIGDLQLMVDLLHDVGMLWPEWIADGKAHKRKQLAKFMQTWEEGK